jgi:hypothetical protein
VIRALAVPVRGLGWWTIAQFLFVGEFGAIQQMPVLKGKVERARSEAP